MPTVGRQGRGPAAVILPLLAGVLLVQWLPRLWSPWLSLLWLLLALAALLRGRRWRLPAWCLLGVAWAAGWGQLALQQRLPPALVGRELAVVGEIYDLPQAGPGLTRFMLRLQTLPGQPRWHGRVRLAWYHPPPLRPCQRWRLLLRLRRPRGLRNPGVADSERTALERRLAAVGYVRQPHQARLLGTSRCVDGLRARLSARLARVLPARHAAALLRAFAVGDVNGLDEADWAVARANGIPHLIAISGFHVGMAGWLGAWLLRLIYACWPELGLYWPRPLASRAAVVVCAAAYCALAGFGVPCVRTLLMMSVALGFQSLRRTHRASSGWWLALAAVLLVDPLACLSAGFWLSFVGVALLMFSLQQRALGWRGWLRELSLGQALMTASLLPLTLWFFGEASWLGLVSNLLAVPLVSFVVVPLVLLSLPWLWLGWPLADGLLHPAAWVVDGLWRILVWLAQAPGAHWQPPLPGLPGLLLATAGMVWLWLPRGLPLRWLGVLLWLPLLWPPLARPPRGGLWVWGLDVGQGLAVLVQTRHHLLVYDAGARYPSGYDLGTAVVLPAIHALGLGRVDGLMISHGDNDHAGGALAVATAFPQARRWAGEPARMRYPSPACQAGQHWQWDAVEFRVLAPPAMAEVGRTGGGNARSCVLLVSTAGARLLLTGDIDARVERYLAAHWPAGPPSLLQVPHHGSRSASSEAFVQAVQPTLAWVSAGWHNRFGHPHPDVLARYRRWRVGLWNTADSGALWFELPATGPPRLRRRWRDWQRRYWRE